MCTSKYLDDRTEELTIRNLIKATKEGRCKWIKVLYPSYIQYQHILMLSDTKLLNIKIYFVSGNVTLNLYISQAHGDKFNQILTSKLMILHELIKTIEDTKSFNQNVY